MSSVDEHQAYITYYFQRRWYQHVIQYCETRLKRSLGDTILMLWRAVAISENGNPTVAIQELLPLQEKRDFGLVWHLAMLSAHNNCKYVDNEAIEALKAKFTVITNQSLTERANVLAGWFCFYTRDTQSAIAYFDQALTQNQNSISALNGKAWAILVSSIPKSNPFQQTLDKSARDVDALIGNCYYLRACKKYQEAEQGASTLISYYPNFIPSYVERIYIQLATQNWEAVLENAQRLGGISPENIDSMITICLYEVCCEGANDSVATFLSATKKSIDKLETNNSALIFNTAKAFGRLANRNPKILNECALMIQKAIQLDGTQSDFFSELGYIYFLMNDLTQSKEAYERSLKANAQNMMALEGLIRCCIANGNYQSAKDQLELLSELQGSLGTSEGMLQLNGLLYKNHYQMPDKALQQFRDALKAAFTKMKKTAFSLDFYSILNPDLILDVAKEYLDIVESLDDKSVSFNQQLEELLSLICKIVPGLTEARFLLAKVYLLLQDPTSAERHLQTCIAKDKQNQKAQLLMAEILLQKQNYSGAFSALEMALSFNFQVRHNIRFILLKAKCLNGMENYGDAIVLLKSAFQQSSVKEAIKVIESQQQWTKSPNYYELVTLYLLLIEAQTNAKYVEEGSMTMAYASRLFAGTMYEAHFILSQGKSALVKGEIQKALDIFQTIKPNQPGYLEARSTMADIFLNHKHDRKKYANCFREVVEKNPTTESCLLLGDAYMKILEPEEAIAVYQRALKSNPESIFVQKIGQAYALMHDYSRAITYYKTAIANATGFESYALRLDLAKILRRLRRYDECKSVLEDSIEKIQGEQDSVKFEAELRELMGELMSDIQQFDSAVGYLNEAKALQIRLLARSTEKESEQNSNKIVSICHKIAEIMEQRLKNNETAINCYNEALQYRSKDLKTMISLAKLYMRMNNLSMAQTQLNTILVDFPKEGEASQLMGDILFGSTSFQSALVHYHQILESDPENFVVLAKYIDVCRRIGKMDLVEQILIKNTTLLQKSKLNPGYHYCRGLYFKYTSKLNESLKEFVLCKRDAIWGEKTLAMMIEIFLNPGNETIGGEALESATDNSASNSNLNSEAEKLGATTADRLLREFSPTTVSLRYQVLECQILMSSKQKPDIERAINILMEILNTEREYIPAIYGTAVGFMLLKQTPRARNQLKRLMKIEWNLEFAEEIEKSWLLLADIYIQGGKYDLAIELLKKVAAVNQSCTKAWEYLGFIMEKEQSYKDAAENYYKCWKLEKHSNPTIGFKLAFNYLKAKRFTDAIDISHAVLQAFPDYPKIRSDILQKARNSLRFP